MISIIMVSSGSILVSAAFTEKSLPAVEKAALFLSLLETFCFSSNPVESFHNNL